MLDISHHFVFQILAATSIDQAVGKFHPLFLHFPIVLFTAALITDLLNYFGKTKAFIAGHWLVIAGVVTCIPTIITGLAAASSFDPTDYLIEKHRDLGFATGISGSLYAGLRISAMLWNLGLKPIHYVGFSVLLVALVSWTSDYGGLITRGTTPFSELQAIEPKENSSQEVSDTEQMASLDEKLRRNINLSDVVPIFAAHRCEECHAKRFSNGVPRRFFEGKHAFLERNAEGGLKDFTQSNFYKTVLVGNEMPLDDEGKPVGLSVSERMILLAWLQNGAPME